MPELNLVKPTEYEELMAKIQSEKERFRLTFEETIKAVADIIFAYGYLQRQFFVPGRPLGLDEFVVINKNDRSFVYFEQRNNQDTPCLNSFLSSFEKYIKKLVAFSWNWQTGKIDTKKFTDSFYREPNISGHVFIFLESLYSYRIDIYLGYNRDYILLLIPPNLEELLEQVLEYRKQKETKKEEKNGNQN